MEAIFKTGETGLKLKAIIKKLSNRRNLDNDDIQFKGTCFLSSTRKNVIQQCQICTLYCCRKNPKLKVMRYKFYSYLYGLLLAI